PEAVAEMCRDQLAPSGAGPYGLADGWGLGWARYGDGGDGPVFLGHDGTGDGTSCHLRFDPVGGTVVALTGKADTGQALWTDLLDRLRESGLPVADHPSTGAAGLGPTVPGPADCVGRYTNGELEYAVTRDADGGLRLGLGSAAPHASAPLYTLECDAGLRFVLRERATGPLGHRGRFLRDHDGRVSHLQLSGRLARRAQEDPRTP
ncbi:penicillin-binding protein, partial [Kitasatospora sp. NPDC093806]